MAKIIREKYEDGVLVSREIEVSGFRYAKAIKLFLQFIIAVSVAVIALIGVHDSLVYSDLAEQTGITDSSSRCPNVSF